MEASKAAHPNDKHRQAMRARVIFGFVAKVLATKYVVGLLDIGFLVPGGSAC